jgi:hypothetical protein
MQFSIRTLFTLTTIAALLVWVFYVPPQWLGLFLLLLVYCLLPGAVVSGIVYCRGIWQAFFVGMAPWITLTLTSFVFYWFTEYQYRAIPVPWPYNADVDSVFHIKSLLAVPLMIAPLSGLVGVCIRWWALRVRHSHD